MAVNFTRHTAPSCLLLFQDDSVISSYSDGSSVEVSPCGSTFMHTTASSTDIHPLLGLHPETIQQRSIYVTSKYKAKVQYAIDMRNRFASRPYVTSNLLSDFDYKLETYADIKEVIWSTELDEAYIEKLDCGGICLRSIDECSSLILAANNLEFSVEYLCKVSDKYTTRDSIELCGIEKRFGHSPECHPDGNGDTSTTLNTLDIHKFTYVWMIQHFSVKHCPLPWQHPLQLVMNYKQRSMSSNTEVTSKGNIATSKVSVISDNEAEKKTKCYEVGHSMNGVVNRSILTDLTPNNPRSNDFSRCQFPDNYFFANRSKTLPPAYHNATYDNSVIKMPLPSSLPMNCPNSYLHHWRRIGGRHHLNEDMDFDTLVKMDNCALKMMMANGVIYRFFMNPLSAEIYPGDGSVITLKDSRGLYFTHTVVTKDRSTSNKMFMSSIESMLGNSHQAALIRMVNKASRLLKIMHCYNTSNSMTICWQVLEPTQMETNAIAVVIEEKTVPGLGHFTAFSNGHLKVVFSDRTILHITSTDDNQTQNCPDTKQNHATLDEFCNITLPNGQRKRVSICNPDCGYSSYINVALEWVEWLQLSHSCRQELSQLRIRKDDSRLVQTELEKLKCFNYILQNTNLKGVEIKSLGRSCNIETDCLEVKSDVNGIGCKSKQMICPSVGTPSVHDVLHKTSQTICGIDEFLNN